MTSRQRAIYLSRLRNPTNVSTKNSEKMENNFVIAIVSNQVQGNFIAWSKPVEYASSIEDAKNKAEKVWGKLCDDFDALCAANPDSGFIMSESVIIHDGENIL